MTTSAQRGELPHVTDDSARAVFDEQRAVQELERLQLAIEDARQRRRQVADAFDDFVKSFRAPARAGGDNEQIAAAPGSRPGEPPAGMVAAPPVHVGFPADARESAIPAALVHAAGRPAPSARWLRYAGVVAAAVVVFLAGMLLVRAWRTTPTEGNRQAAPVPARLGAATPAAATAAQPAPAVANRGIQGELTTLRRVWVRVIADGERVVERELPAAAQVPLRADRTLVIRVGDAGAVRLSIDGRDQDLPGPDGQVVTRTFTARDPSER